ncbi:hypothetical protein FH968_00625 [Buttiauxella sp. B2]|uniref:hypothetical protein n=1 Tax=Buttiauxella sp. B2 TaxID=2587812 RepID=UPI00111D3F2D|nr:hypothetical protein [Buttiauxella sp. B2]TNV22596.1 hypothetical protein FH968_00625 [Buttiauxella sp. B2]
MYKKFCVIFMATLCYLPVAQASWKTTTEDDVFTAQKKAQMDADISGHNQALIFNCSQNNLTMSEVEKDPNTSVTTIKKYTTIVKIDNNDPVVFDTTLSRRNPDYLQLKTSQTDKIKIVLKQLKDQSSKKDFMIGTADSKGTPLSSYTGSVSFAKKAINKFIATCNIKID